MDSENEICNFLDRIGFSREEIRWRRKVWKDMDTIINQTTAGGVVLHYSGSRPEGTGINALGADVDFMYRGTYLRIIHDYKDWEHLTRVTVLLTETTGLHPGYCRLLLMYENRPMVVEARDYPYSLTPDFTAHNGVIVMLNNTNRLQPQAFRNGPADTVCLPGTGGLDRVSCISTAFPPGAREWVDRDRPSHFPTHEFIHKSAREDILVVPTGYKNSQHPDLEWRFSFSLIELEIVLMWPNNVTRCYILLKMLKNHISSVSPHLSNTLSSYYLKTTLFWLTEETGLSFWERSPVGECLMFSLKRLLMWVERGDIPHYFIKDNNLFDLHTGTTRQTELATFLRDMITEGPACVFRCEWYKNLSVQINTSVSDCRSLLVQRERVFLHGKFAEHIVGEPKVELSFNFTKSMGSLCKALDTLQTDISRYNGDVAKGLDYMRADLRCTLATSVLSMSLQNRMSNVTRHLVFKICEQLLKVSLHEQVGQLKMANFYFQSRHYELATNALQVLVEMESFRLIRLDVRGAGRCFRKRHLLALANTESSAEVLSNMTSVSLLFELPEIHAAPYALKFEMFQPQLALGGEDFVSKSVDVCSVDPLAFVYYLQYLCYENMGKKKHAEVAFDNLLWVAKQKDKIHRDTTWNILGHCYYKQGKLRQALNCHVESLRIQPISYVAVIHVALVIKRAFYQRNEHTV